METALLRCVSSALGHPVASLLGLPFPPPQPVRCFYTVGMAESAEALASDVAYGTARTSYLKFKVGRDVSQIRAIFLHLDGAGVLVPGVRHVALDANCSWSAAFAMEVLTRIDAKHLAHVFMIEQPFPFDMPFTARQHPHPHPHPEEDAENAENAEDGKGGKGGDVAGWIEFKRCCTERGICVYADESMRTHADVLPLVPFCHGVNIKLEKAGGYREAKLAAAACGRSGLRVWMGCMVGSALNCNVIADVLAMCDSGSADLDGFMLVTPECQPCEPTFALGGREGEGEGERDTRGWIAHALRGK